MSVAESATNAVAKALANAATNAAANALPTFPELILDIAASGVCTSLTDAVQRALAIEKAFGGVRVSNVPLPPGIHTVKIDSVEPFTTKAHGLGALRVRCSASDGRTAIVTFVTAGPDGETTNKSFLRFLKSCGYISEAMFDPQEIVGMECLVTVREVQYRDGRLYFNATALQAMALKAQW